MLTRPHARPEPSAARAQPPSVCRSPAAPARRAAAAHSAASSCTVSRGPRPGRRVALAGQRGDQLGEQTDLPVGAARYARRCRGSRPYSASRAATGPPSAPRRRSTRRPRHQQAVLLQVGQRRRRPGRTVDQLGRVSRTSAPAGAAPVDRQSAAGRRWRRHRSTVGRPADRRPAPVEARAARTTAAVGSPRSIAASCSRITRSGRYWSRWAASTNRSRSMSRPAVLAVARRRALRLDQTLGLEEPQLRDGDVGELGPQLAEHLADAHQRAAPGPPPALGEACPAAVICRLSRPQLSSRRGPAMNTSRNLPICTSSPLLSVAASTRSRLT